MKKYFGYVNVLIELLVFSVVAACSSGSDEPGGEVSNEYLNVPSQVSVSGTSSTLEINADCAWTISGMPEWLTVSPSEGKNSTTVTITCKENDSSVKSREASLTIASKSGKTRRTCKVVQAAATEHLSVPQTRVDFSVEGGTKTFSISSNSAWDISGIDDWLTVEPRNGSGNAEIKVTVQPNTKERERKAILTVTVSTLTKSQVEIVQEALVTNLVMSPTTIEATPTSSNYTLSLEGDADWRAHVDQTWMHINQATGTGSAKIELTLDVNNTLEPRSGNVIVAYGEKELVCAVTQQAGELPVVKTFSVKESGRDYILAQVSYKSILDVIETGICVSDNGSDPTIDDTCIISDVKSNEGQYEIYVRSLNPGRQYMMRAFVRNGAGVGYSNAIKITTGGAPRPEDNPDIPL